MLSAGGFYPEEVFGKGWVLCGVSGEMQVHLQTLRLKTNRKIIHLIIQTFPTNPPLAQDPADPSSQPLHHKLLLFLRIPAPPKLPSLILPRRLALPPPPPPFSPIIIETLLLRDPHLHGVPLQKPYPLSRLET